jgi:hypothetical protein
LKNILLGNGAQTVVIIVGLSVLAWNLLQQAGGLGQVAICSAILASLQANIYDLVAQSSSLSLV